MRENAVLGLLRGRSKWISREQVEPPGARHLAALLGAGTVIECREPQPVSRHLNEWQLLHVARPGGHLDAPEPVAGFEKLDASRSSVGFGIDVSSCTWSMARAEARGDCRSNDPSGPRRNPMCPMKSCASSGLMPK